MKGWPGALFLGALLLFLTGQFADSSAQAQIPFPTTSAGDAEAVEAPPQPSPNDIRELARLLADPSVATWLIDRAQSLENAPESEAVSLDERAEAALIGLQARLGDISDAVAALPSAPATIAAVWTTQLTLQQRLGLINLMIIFLFAGAGLEWLYWRYAGLAKRRLELNRTEDFLSRVRAASVWLALVTGGAFLFALGAIGGFSMFEWPKQAHDLILELLVFLVAMRFFVAISRFVLAPQSPTVRLLPITCRDASLVFFGSIAVIAILFSGVALADATRQLGGSDATILAVRIATAALAAVAAIGMLWWRHAGLPSPSNRLDNFIAIGGSVIIAAIFLLWLVGFTQAAWTLAIIAIAARIARTLYRLIVIEFSPPPRNDPGEEGEEAASEDVPGEAVVDDNPNMVTRIDDNGERDLGLYAPIAIRIARFSVIGVALFAIGSVWGIWSPGANGTAGAELFEVLIDVAVAFLIGELIWTGTKTAIDRRMANMPKTEPGKSPGPEARLATLLPVIKITVLFAVIAMVVLSALSSMGVNIAPLLAGAGVVGLAIGFGAQALVRDIVSGVFFLIDDAFRVGEYIEMGELRGTVEAISLRSLRVRHHRGAVHTIPFGELKSLTNYSRDWVMMKLEFRVPFETDLARCKKIVKKIDAELRANPDYGNAFLQPLKFQGVRRMEEFNMVVGVKFMTKPGEQWTIRRDAYQRIRDEFEKAGINFAQRNVKVEVVGSGEITEEVRQKAVGAAQDAIEQQAAVPAQ